MSNRPPAGWAESISGDLVYVMHDATLWDSPPTRAGYECRFVGRHGIGPGSYTRWFYRKVEPKQEEGQRS